MGKKSGPGSGIRIWENNPDHISESLETILRVKIPKLFDTDPGIRDEKKIGSGMEKIKIRIQDPGWKKIGSGMEKIPIQDHGMKKIWIRDVKNSKPGSGMK